MFERLVHNKETYFSAFYGYITCKVSGYLKNALHYTLHVHHLANKSAMLQNQSYSPGSGSMQHIFSELSQ